LGAPNSSNSIRLCEVAKAKGLRSYLIERAADIKKDWLKNVRILGLTAGASAPEVLVQEVVKYVRDHFGVSQVEEFETVEENMHFSLPYELDQIVKSASLAKK
jgi:4-hydroxy-3-methylbut-2-enyl diphosphate reductase